MSAEKALGNRKWQWATALARVLQRVIRPFVDFYFNYGLSRASVLSYVMCANLVIFVYLLLIFSMAVTTGPLQSKSSAARFLELHVLWHVEDKWHIKNAPSGFPLAAGDLVSSAVYDQAVEEYQRKHDKIDPRVAAERFSVTEELSADLLNAIEDYSQNKRKIRPLGIVFIGILLVAYLALWFNVKTNLAEVDSPLVWGNLPLRHRRSEIMKILWRIPNWSTIKSYLVLFVMLPFLVLVAILLLSAGQWVVDSLWEQGSRYNITSSALFSLIITGILLTSLYKLTVPALSKRNAAIGAFIAATLWLVGRWLFTTYAAVSLYRTLYNFTLIPIVLSWFYYFCVVFLFGLHVAHTLENPGLSNTARSWIMRYILPVNRYATLSTWVRFDFLFRLAQSRYQDYRPPFLCIQGRGDTAEEIARLAHLPPTFVRECILEMLLQHPGFFCVEEEGNRQYCTLKIPAEEVDVIPLLFDPEDMVRMFGEMEDYTFGRFILAKFGSTLGLPEIKLSDVYRHFRTFQEKLRSTEGGFCGETEEIPIY